MQKQNKRLLNEVAMFQSLAGIRPTSEFTGYYSNLREDIDEAREGVYDDFNKWKASFPEGTAFKQESNYVMAKDQEGKELGKWNPIEKMGMHSDDFQYKTLEEVDLSWIPAAAASMGLESSSLKDVVDLMKAKNYKGIQGFLKAYKEVGSM